MKKTTQISCKYKVKLFEIKEIDLERISILRSKQQELSLTEYSKRFLKDIKRKKKLTRSQRMYLDTLYISFSEVL